MKSHPVEDSLVDRIDFDRRGHLFRQWSKAHQRVDEDPDGAVTAARSLLESICKHVLEATDVAYSSSVDLPGLFKQVASELRISADGQIARMEQQIYSGVTQVVKTLAELRNSTGDAHGKGAHGTRPSPAQAELAVNLAGTLGAFLLRKLDSHLAATRRLNSRGHAVLRFDKSTVWRLVDHAQNAPGHALAYRQRKPRPSIWLVADDGIYLISNGRPALLETGRLAKDSDREDAPLLCAFADGCGPLDDPDAWEPIKNAVVSDADWCEPIELKDVRNALEASDRQIVIVSSPRHYRIYPDREFDDLGTEANLD